MSHQGFTSTFKEFKQRFYSKIGDASCFNVQNINLLKVVLDGLKVQYSLRGKVNHYFNRPAIIFFAYLFKKAILTYLTRKVFRTSINHNNDSKILIGFSSRCVEENSKNYSLDFQHFFNAFGRNKFCYIIEEKNDINADCNLNDIQFGFNFLAKNNIKLYFEIKRFVKKIKGQWEVKEYLDIQIACFLFFVQYLKWDYFFKNKLILKAIIEQHYHREGFILACRKHGVGVIELQHGLIANEDIFYVFPYQVSGVIDKALFPDKIFVFGDYWKQVLLNGCEYKDEQIINSGYFQYKKNAVNQLLFSKEAVKNRILITTQYSIETYFIEYVKKISPLLDHNWEIILKPHPVENTNTYAELSTLTNVKIMQGDLDCLILNCEFVISIFSTTIFDAVRLNKVAFSLYFPLFSDYVNGIIESGAAYLLLPEDNPVERFNNATKKKKSNNFYSELDIETCRTMIFNTQ